MKGIVLQLCSLGLLIMAKEIYSSPIENLKNKTSTTESLDTLDVLQDIQENDFAKDILSGSKALLSNVKKLQKTAKETYEKEIIKIQETLTALMQGVDKLDEKHNTIAANALTEILKIKTTLRLTRTELNELSERIIDAVDEFTATAEAIFQGEVTTKEEIDTFLNFDVVTMKDLLGEGQALVDKAQEAYATVGLSLASVEDNLIKYKQCVEIIVNDATRTILSHNKDVTISRATIYPSCATSTTVCIFVDIFLTFGACSAINGATCATLITSLEATIATVGPHLKALNGRADKAHATITDLMADQKRLITYFVSEKELLSRLDSKLSNTSLNLNKSRALFYTNIPTLRNRYLQSLDNLKKAAEDYINQPELDF